MPSDPEPEMEPQTESEPVDSQEVPNPDDSQDVYAALVNSKNSHLLRGMSFYLFKGKYYYAFRVLRAHIIIKL